MLDSQQLHSFICISETQRRLTVVSSILKEKVDTLLVFNFSYFLAKINLGSFAIFETLQQFTLFPQHDTWQNNSVAECLLKD